MFNYGLVFCFKSSIASVFYFSLWVSVAHSYVWFGIADCAN